MAKDAAAWSLPLTATLHAVAENDVFMAAMDAVHSIRVDTMTFGREPQEAIAMEATLLYPEAVTLLPDASTTVFATVTLEES